jgi:anti-sigma factor RsiW
MSRCARARELFGPYWDDETTKAEREWMDAHFASCAACRADYEALARTLSAVGALPRHEAAPDLAERALAAARRASPAPDRVLVRQAPRWTAVAVAASLVLLAAATIGPRLAGIPGTPAPLASRSARVAEPRMVAVNPPEQGRVATSATAANPSFSDSLFDHSEDVDFVLDPVTLRRGRAHTTTRQPGGIKSEAAVITF